MTNKEAIDKLITLKTAQAFSEDGKPLEPDFDIAVNKAIEALEKAGKKKEQAPYKIILNSTYGIFKDKYSSAYDPKRANEVCVNGQLLLIDLIDKL